MQRQHVFRLAYLIGTRKGQLRATLKKHVLNVPTRRRAGRRSRTHGGVPRREARDGADTHANDAV
jgi:hypothetical protein